jgi:SAM-dependent methyltransferase
MALLTTAAVLFLFFVVAVLGQIRHPSTAAAAASPGSPPVGGSSYEDYSKTSRHYDNFRRPIGLDVIRDALEANAYGTLPLCSQLPLLLSYLVLLKVRQMDLKKSFKLLDAGCGSGSYLAELRDDVAEVHGLEFNEGMMMQAVGKKNLTVTQGSITEMPFKPSSFDSVLTTQVLHHLEPKDCSDEERAQFKGLAKACKEAYRMLKPGGAWIISTQTPAQHVDG